MNITDKTNAQDFARFVDLQQRHTKLHTVMEQLEVTMNLDAQKAAEGHTAAYVVLQEDFAKLDVELKALFAKYPEWRGEKKSVTTPFGSVEQRSVVEIEIPNPKHTVALIKARGATDKEFHAADFLHVEEKPNVEALERFTDAQLAELGASRVRRESVSVKPAKVSATKIVKGAKKAKPPQIQEAA